MIQYVILGTPKTKKNSMNLVKVHGRMIPVQSDAYKKFEATSAQYLQPKPEKPIDYPVEVTCLYFYPLNKDGSMPKRPVDLLNLMAASHDVLVKHGILADDNTQIIRSVDGSRLIWCTEDPKTIITIHRLESDNEKETNS